MPTHSVLQDRIQKLVLLIRSLNPNFQKMADAFREGLDAQEPPSFDKWSAEDWCKSVFGDALLRLRQLTENNFQTIEPLGLLAVSRYIFELSVWLQLLNKDARFGLVYYGELLRTQLRYYKDTSEQLRREIALLKTFGEKDRDSLDAALANAISEDRENQNFGTLISQAMTAVDAEAPVLRFPQS